MTHPTTLVTADGKIEHPVVALTGWFRPADVEFTQDRKGLLFHYQPPFESIRAVNGVTSSFIRLEKSNDEGVLDFAKRWGRLSGFSKEVLKESASKFDSLIRDINSLPEAIHEWREKVQLVRNIVERIEDMRRRGKRLDRGTEKQINTWLWTFAHPALEWDRRRTSFCPRLHASGLLGAIGLELLALAGGSGGLIPCVKCGEFFETDDGRRKFCDECRDSSEKELRRPACKRASQRYRKTRQQARALARQGKSPEQIAIDLQRDVRRIRKWIKTIS